MSFRNLDVLRETLADEVTVMRVLRLIFLVVLAGAGLSVDCQIL